MAHVHFTTWLRQHVANSPLHVAGATVGDALSAVFMESPHLRGYVLDEQGRLRKHVCIFADGTRLPREATLDHKISPDSQIYVMQALSGG